MERAVELVGLNHYLVRCRREYVVGVIVLGDAAEEGVAADSRLVHDVRTHSRGGSLSVCPGKAETLALLREHTENLGAFHHLEAVLAEEGQLAVTVGDGRRVADDGLGRRFEYGRHAVNVVFVVYVDTFGNEGFGERRRRLVVASDFISVAVEISFECRHPDATGSYEIYGFHLFASLSGWV